jgi:ABC-2 type transport system permease protein
MLGGWLVAGVILSLLIVISLAGGLVLAAISATESQAVQLSMLTLLFTIFFSGLFVSVASIEPPIQFVSYLVPVTHAGAALRQVMLRGGGAPVAQLEALGLMVGVFVPLAYLLTGRVYRLR